MSRAGVVILVAVVTVALAAGASAMRASSLTVPVKQWNHSGATGSFVLTPVRDGVAFTLRMSIPRSLKGRGVTFLAHINRVSCARFARLSLQARNHSLQFPLAYVVKGISRGTLSIRLSRLRDGDHSIEVGAAGSLYRTVACGTIPRR
jgi:hypothetical protein